MWCWWAAPVAWRFSDTVARRIRLLGKGDFYQSPGSTLLTAGRQAGFGFPQACRNGNCEKCAVTLTGGIVQPMRQLLTGYYPSSNRILPCICEALTDCEIEAVNVTAPGEILPQKAACQLLSHQALSPTVEELRLNLPAGRKFHWHAGQYLLLEHPLDGNVSAFSIANACLPGNRELILHLRHEPGNASAEAIFQALHTESMFRLELPFGNRGLAEPPDRSVWLIAGSTGFAPAQALLQQLHRWQFARPVHCYRGAVQAADIYPTQELALLRSWPYLKLTEAVERDAAPGQFSGRVLEAVCADIKQQKEAFAQKGWPLAFIGGSPEMAWATFDALVAEGWPEDLIHSDVFDYAPRNVAPRND